VLEKDYICGRCRMEVRAFIRHECDPSICSNCEGTGWHFVGREGNEWVGSRKCQPCAGTGRTIWAD